MEILHPYPRRGKINLAAMSIRHIVDERVISASFVPEVGPWAEDKLECLRKYLAAYTTILRKQRFKGYGYVDAFAGAGTAKIRKKKGRGMPIIRRSSARWAW